MSEQSPNSIAFDIHFQRGRNGRRELRMGSDSATVPESAGHITRISHLMALAIKLDGMVQRREVRDYAELARLGGVTRARVTQIMNLLTLAPDIQDELLHLPAVANGRDPIRPRQLVPLLRTVNWSEQRKLWEKTRQAFHVVREHV